MKGIFQTFLFQYTLKSDGILLIILEMSKSRSSRNVLHPMKLPPGSQSMILPSLWADPKRRKLD